MAKSDPLRSLVEKMQGSGEDNILFSTEPEVRGGLLFFLLISRPGWNSERAVKV